ncbi:MAG TPA: hypothetical protein H9898_04205 [Candidatus Anaerobiospirillum stercoravium]|nr:hypothetical protein [Candidatus Anaerobiospirillum stercoravium]
MSHCFVFKRACTLSAVLAALALGAAGCASDTTTPDEQTPQYGLMSDQERLIIKEITGYTQDSLEQTHPHPAWTPDNSAAYQDILRHTDIVYDEETASFINQEGAPASREQWQQSLKLRQSQLMDTTSTPSSSGT